MEFPFDINAVLPLEITILNGDYRILNHGHTARILYVESKLSFFDDCIELRCLIGRQTN